MQIKKLAASALGTLMAGASLAFPAAAASMEDLPAPFIEDGEADFSMVVGQDAAPSDVVGAIDVATTMGGQPTVEEEVETEGGVSEWTADNGITLNRENSNLFLYDATDAEESRLDSRDLDALSSTEFTSEDGEDVDVEYEANIGSENQSFNTAGDHDDPLLHVNVDTDAEEDELFSATVEFSDSIDFTETDHGEGDADEVLEDGDEISLFGTEYSFSDESDKDTLVLYENSETFDVEDGDEETVEIGDDEHTFETVTVNEEGDSATIRVDEELEEVNEDSDDEITVGDTDIRVRNIFSTGSDGEGVVEFAIGSDELNIHEDGEVEKDEDEVEGVHAELSGGDFNDVDDIEFRFGAADSDEDYLEAGDSYTDPVFGALEFHYGGLSPNAAEDPAETVEVEAEDEEAAEISFMDESGEDADIAFKHEDADNNLAVDDDEDIATYDGQSVKEEEHLILNQNEDAAMYQVTDVDDTDLQDARDSDDDNDPYTEDGEVSVELENVVTGESVTVEDDGLEIDDDAAETVELKDESVEGMDFDVTFEGDDHVSLESTYDDGQAVYPNLYSESGAAVAFAEEASNFASITADDEDSDTQTHDIRLPSTTSSGDLDVTVEIDESNEEATVTGDGVSDADTEDVDEGATIDFTAGEVDYDLELSNETFDGNAGDTTFDLTLNVDEADSNPSAMVLQPEDDEEDEHGFIFEPKGADDDEVDGGVDVGYTGEDDDDRDDVRKGGWATQDMDSEDNVEVGYNTYGTYTEYDTDDDDEVFTAQLPEAQSTSGMALTGEDGELSAEGGGGSVSYDRIMPVYDAVGALDSEVEDPASQDLILVGGPTVNTLVDDLVQEGKIEGTGAEEEEEDTFEWQEDTPEVQLVEDAFADGQTALVVAGWDPEDTRDAAFEVQDQLNPDTESPFA
ncbi:MAG: S-layer protein [Candidatus Aenigmatarchaeota archaeon]